MNPRALLTQKTGAPYEQRIKVQKVSLDIQGAQPHLEVGRVGVFLRLDQAEFARAASLR